MALHIDTEDLIKEMRAGDFVHRTDFRSLLNKLDSSVTKDQISDNGCSGDLRSIIEEIMPVGLKFNADNG